ncbi:MAG: WG repeat-containing protein [Bacillus subtilis]|nr:WG repeat-containing protein [Bacillus subtilis]
MQKDGRFGYINEKGKKVIEFYYDQAYAFQDGVALVKVGTKWNLIDKKGDKVFEDDYAYLERDPETDLIWFVENDKLGLMNKNGKVLAEPIYDVTKSGSTYYNDANFSEGLAARQQRHEIRIHQCEGRRCDRSQVRRSGILP